jgi:hypothetical protein
MFLFDRTFDIGERWVKKLGALLMVMMLTLLMTNVTARGTANYAAQHGHTQPYRGASQQFQMNQGDADTAFTGFDVGAADVPGNTNAFGGTGAGNRNGASTINLGESLSEIYNVGLTLLVGFLITLMASAIAMALFGASGWSSSQPITFVTNMISTGASAATRVARGMRR